MVATANRCEGVYNRAGEPSEIFCGRGEIVERVTDFYKIKIGTSITRSDVVRRMGLKLHQSQNP